MAISAANTNSYPDMTKACHDFYALGQRVVNMQTEYGISNTVMNGICVEVKGARPLTNTLHIAILTALAGN